MTVVAQPNMERPRISVCLATFNGERYLREQIESVLAQLVESDELIVNEDGSTDSTLAILRSYEDPRIKILPLVPQLGPMRAFERAISHTTGEIIFLCDQDDVWLPGKVDDSLEILRDPDVLAVVSDAYVIDAEGKILIESYRLWRGSQEGFWRNWLKNGFLGCCMAFRSTTKHFLLPFPANINMHDEWIGLCCATAGIVRFTSKKLILYRRHGDNTTAMRHLSVSHMIKKRIVFLMSIAIRLPALLRSGARAK